MPKAANAATMAVVQPKLKAELRKHVENPLAKARAKECKQCEQNSHQQDFHSSPDNPHWVTWMRCVTHADGILHPAGEECHACGAPRRKAFFVEEELRQPEGSTGPPQKKRRMATLGELKEARKDATINDALMRFRKAFVQTGSMKSECAEVGKFDCSKTKASVEKTDEHRAKEYRDKEGSRRDSGGVGDELGLAADLGFEDENGCVFNEKKENHYTNLYVYAL